MQFLTSDECMRWLANQVWPEPGSIPQAVLAYSKVPSRIYFISRWIANDLSYDSPVLLWVGDSIVSQSNWHLYYRLRESYGDRRLIDDAPGHLCLNYETEDLATLLYLTMLYGWDAKLIPELGYVNLQFSHHRFIDVFSEDNNLVEDVRKNASDVDPTVK